MLDLTNAELDNNDVKIGAKYSFLDKKFKFAALKILNKEEKDFEVQHEFELAYEHSENNSIKLNHKDENLGIEVDCGFWSSENQKHRLGLYKKYQLDKESNLSATVQLLYGLGSNFFFHFGLRNYGLHINKGDFCELSRPYFSFGGLYRFVKDTNRDGYAGLNVDLKKTSVEKVRSVIGFRYDNLNTLLNLSVEPLSCNSYKTGADFGLDHQVNEDLNVFGYLKIENTPAEGDKPHELSNQFTIGAAYHLDKVTDLRLNLKSDISASFGFFKKFSNFINFALVTSFAKQEKATDGFKTKFGLTVEFEENEE